MGSKRRYKITPETDVYHRMFDRLRIESNILNSGSNKRNIFAPNLGERFELEGLLLKYKGIPDGPNKGAYFVPDAQQWRMAIILTLEAELLQIEQRWKNYQARVMREGRKCPEKMPDEMEERLYKTQATYDIALEEFEDIQRRLEVFTKAEEAIHAQRVLEKGPHGMAVLKGGRIAELDGQRCGLSSEGIPVITEKTSPFFGMSTADYFEFIVHPWGLAKKERRKQLRREVKRNIRDKMPLKSSAPWSKKWPENVKNYLQNGTEKGDNKDDKKTGNK